MNNIYSEVFDQKFDFDPENLPEQEQAQFELDELDDDELETWALDSSDTEFEDTEDDNTDEERSPDKDVKKNGTKDPTSGTRKSSRPKKGFDQYLKKHFVLSLLRT